MSSYQYRKSHYGDKTIVRPSYLHNGVSLTGKMICLYYIRAKCCFLWHCFPNHIQRSPIIDRFILAYFLPWRSQGIIAGVSYQILWITTMQITYIINDALSSMQNKALLYIVESWLKIPWQQTHLVNYYCFFFTLKQFKGTQNALYFYHHADGSLSWIFLLERARCSLSSAVMIGVDGDRVMKVAMPLTYFPDTLRLWRQGLYSLRGQTTSYRKISWNLEDVRLGFRLLKSLWSAQAFRQRRCLYAIKFQSDTMMTLNLAASRLHEIWRWDVLLLSEYRTGRYT